MFKKAKLKLFKGDDTHIFYETCYEVGRFVCVYDHVASEGNSSQCIIYVCNSDAISKNNGESTFTSAFFSI